jgi:hypothetical protein
MGETAFMTMHNAKLLTPSIKDGFHTLLKMPHCSPSRPWNRRLNGHYLNSWICIGISGFTNDPTTYSVFKQLMH